MEQEQVIRSLNENLRAELSAVEMYSAHAEAIPEDVVAEGVRAILQVERRHARDLARRIVALGGTPVEPGGVETVAGRAAGASTAQAATAEMLRLELAEEQQAIKDYAEEIAEIMGIPLGTVKTYIHRARLRLRDMILADPEVAGWMGVSEVGTGGEGVDLS